MKVPNNDSAGIKRFDIMMNNDLQTEERQKLISIFNEADTDSQKGILTGSEIDDFKTKVLSVFKDNSKILSMFNIRLGESPAEAETVEKEEDEQPGQIPPKTADGSLTKEQVQEYIKNSPRCIEFRKYLANCTDFTRKKVVEHDLENLPKVLENWVDTPKDADVSQSFVRQGTTTFTHVRRETLPDGTKVYNTAQGYYNLWFNGLPGGKKMSEEELRSHGWQGE